MTFLPWPGFVNHEAVIGAFEPVIGDVAGEAGVVRRVFGSGGAARAVESDRGQLGATSLVQCATSRIRGPLTTTRGVDTRRLRIDGFTVTGTLTVSTGCSPSLSEYSRAMKHAL